MAVSVHLLDFYNALFERLCDAVNALAAALNTFYKQRGFVLVNSKGQAMQDPFRKGLGYVIQWYSNLQVQIEKVVEAAVVSADAHYRQLSELSKELETTDTPQLNVPPTSPMLECACILQRQCPACFGGVKFGRPLTDGANIHVCVNGNFNHRHLKSSGDCPQFYKPEFMLPKTTVDSIGELIEKAHRKPPKPRQPLLPDEAVDGCESTHVAGSRSNSKTNMEKFDDGGVMALICRHDVPLFLANIDTPGEQQKYAVALLLHLFSLLPLTAMVSALYNVGCVLDQSSQLFDIFPEDVVSRLLFATSAMHAYIHKWACQLRTSAQRVLKECGVPIEVLRDEWDDQRRAQLSVRAHAPTRLKKELDSVLSLQGQMEALDQAIQSLCQELSKAQASATLLDLLSKLEQMQEVFQERGEALYSSLNVHKSFPGLMHVDLKFVRLLLATRDLKINICKCAIGSFLE
ncbi:hypothetical protein C0991_012342 [Blastosporella zonata]|nr:hypothetical protein C0991_012342 [Blastosporella zonata]